MSLKKMFTPPKSKSPWEAATSGSTGGWAGFAGPSQTTNPNDKAGWGWVGPALTAGMGMIPGIGPGLAAGMGAIGASGQGGFQGTDSGWGKGIMDTLGGAASGYGLGALGAGAKGAISGAMGATGGLSGAWNGLTSGFSSGMNAYNAPLAGAWNNMTGGAAQSGYAANAGQFGPLGTGTAAGSQAAYTNSLLGGFGGASGVMANTAKGVQDFLSNPMTLLGGALIGGSQMMGTTPEVPGLGEISAKWLNADSVTKAGAMAKDIMTDEYMGDFMMSKETQALMNVQEKEISKHYGERRKSLDKMGLASNEQFLNSGERLEMLNRMNEEEQDQIDSMRSEWLYRDKQQYSQTKYNTVMQSLQIDEQTKRDLLFGESWEIMQKYNVEMQTLMDFRGIARDAGLYMMQQGMS